MSEESTDDDGNFQTHKPVWRSKILFRTELDKLIEIVDGRMAEGYCKEKKGWFSRKTRIVSEPNNSSTPPSDGQ